MTQTHEQANRNLVDLIKLHSLRFHNPISDSSNKSNPKNNNNSIHRNNLN